MAQSLSFFLVDVFANAPLTGNPLAVVADADDVDEGVMRAVAREFNQSETTFVLASPRADVAWRLRSFTPAGIEVGGAGHNALGAWWWLATSGRLQLSESGGRFAGEIGESPLPVEVIAERGHPRAIAMDQEAPTLGSSTRRWASPRIPRPAPPPGRLPATWSITGSSPTARPC
jgi:trans-2,3-dihydro-3-hydroxyanthranilate isomerase